MVSMNFRSPIFCPSRRCAAWGESDMFSCPPAITIEASPSCTCWAASATARRPEPQTWFIPQAGASIGRPAAICAWRAGFCPCAAVSTCPKMVSDTASFSTPARSSAASIAAAPSSWAGTLAKAPLKLPIAVRAAEAMTTSVMVHVPPQGGCFARVLAWRSFGFNLRLGRARRCEARWLRGRGGGVSMARDVRSSRVDATEDETDKQVDPGQGGQQDSGGEAEPIVIRKYANRSEEHTSELQSRGHLVCRLLLEKKNDA